MRSTSFIAIAALAAVLLEGCGRGASAPEPLTPPPPTPVWDPTQRTGDLGSLSFPVSGAAPAQEAFRRGVAWLHNFGYEDAIDAFRTAQASDPDFAMAYWGEAMAFSQPLWFFEEPEKGRAALAKLGPTPEARIAKGRTPREQGYLRAVEALWGAGDKAARLAAFRDAMATLATSYPNDDEAQVFHALALLATMPRGDASLPIREQAGAIAEAVFARNPFHPGAAHLILHAYDHATLAPRGLAAARAYAKVAPASSHALHMPAHFFVQLGHWAEAAASDAAAWQASVDWSMRRRMPVTTYDFHSLVWWQYALTQLGQFQKAREIAEHVDRALAIATEQSVIGGHHYSDSEIGRGSGPAALRNDKGSMRARLVVESLAWHDLAGQATFDNVDELYALAVSALALEDAPRARAAHEALVKAAAPTMDAGLREQAAIMVLEVEAIAAAIEGTPGVVFSKLDAAAALQAKMPKPIGRPYPVKGVDELYGELLLRFERPREAVTWFEKALVRTPNRSRAVLGLARAAAMAGDAVKSRTAYAQFLENWKDADPDRPELAEARAALARR